MKTIAVVCGGYSKEEIVSLKSAEQIAQTIDLNKFKVYTVLININEWVVKTSKCDLPIDRSDFTFILDGIKIKFDAIFMAIHGTPGEDGKLQSYFELLNIPLTTCNSFVSALTFNKYATKAYLSTFEIPSAKAIVLRKNYEISEEEIISRLGLPIFVKPNNGGSSFGITKVKEANQLAAAIEKSLVEDPEVILEEFVEGREFTCGVFNSGNESLVLPVTEIVSKTEFFDYDAKYEGLADEITPAQISEEQTEKCQNLSNEIYKMLGCSGLVRIDYLLRKGVFYFMEVNTVPGMSQESIIPQQVKAYGMNITDFYSKLIEDALSRG